MQYIWYQDIHNIELQILHNFLTNFNQANQKPSNWLMDKYVEIVMKWNSYLRLWNIYQGLITYDRFIFIISILLSNHLKKYYRWKFNDLHKSKISTWLHSIEKMSFIIRSFNQLSSDSWFRSERVIFKAKNHFRFILLRLFNTFYYNLLQFFTNETSIKFLYSKSER